MKSRLLKVKRKGRPECSSRGESGSHLDWWLWRGGVGGGQVFGTRLPPSIQGDSSCSVCFTPSRIQQIRAGGVPSPKCITYSSGSRNVFLLFCLLGTGWASSSFFFFALYFFVFPLRGESLTDGGRFCLTPAMFAAPASWE